MTREALAFEIAHDEVTAVVALEALGIPHSLQTAARILDVKTHTTNAKTEQKERIYAKRRAFVGAGYKKTMSSRDNCALSRGLYT